MASIWDLWPAQAMAPQPPLLQSLLGQNKAIGNALINSTGIPDAYRAASGQMTPNEAQMFALGALPALFAPEAKAATEAVSEAAPSVAKFIRAYHGSPYDFDKFDLSKIGTGEGAQAYGHGLYFAENPQVAQTYKNMLTQKPGTPEYYAQLHLNRAGGDPDAAVKSLMDTGLTRGVKAYGDAVNLIQGGWRPQTGKTYEVNINADPSQFLDWDKPLSQQPEVQKRLAASGNMAQYASGPGSDVYNIAGSPGSGPPNAAAATAALRQAGIPGIRYLDQGSRNYAPSLKAEPIAPADPRFGYVVRGGHHDVGFPTLEEANQYIASMPPKQTSNYVVFDPSIIDIVRKYGIAGLSLLGAGASQLAPPQQQAPVIPRSAI